MSRFLILFSLLTFSVSVFGQTPKDTNSARSYAYKVVPGKTYLVSVTPESTSDAVLAVGIESGKPMVVTNNQGIGVSETYKVQALQNELQVSVFVNSESGKHTIVVISDDGKFPYYKWNRKYPIVLKTDNEGFIESFGFSWQVPMDTGSKASDRINESQFIAADSAILYTFSSRSRMPLDIMVVPDTNHLDLALQIGAKDEYELNDNNRNPADLRETSKGQVEWVQFAPSGDELNVVVINKSDYAGSFKMAVRSLFEEQPSLRPTKWRILNKLQLDALLDNSRSKLPYIDDKNAATFEFTPLRRVKSYTFGAVSLDPGLNFGLLVRFDPDEPPMFIQGIGSYTRFAVFGWDSDQGVISIFSQERGLLKRFKGYPSAGKMEISIVGYGGKGRVGVFLKDDTLAPLKLPEHKFAPRESVTSLLSEDYNGYEAIKSNVKILRYEAVLGETYKVQVKPYLFFDAVLMDPSGRNFENPTALALMDDAGWGKTENLEIMATVDFIEFAVAGTRYVNGIIDIDRKRIGGTGFVSIDVRDSEGNSPKLREALDITLPNEFISSEIDLIYQPWDPFENETASDLPPRSVILDSRIEKALNHPLEPVRNASKPKPTRLNN